MESKELLFIDRFKTSTPTEDLIGEEVLSKLCLKTLFEKEQYDDQSLRGSEMFEYVNVKPSLSTHHFWGTKKVLSRLKASTIKGLYIHQLFLIKKKLGLNGLRNLGNTCYMNAALQALSNCPPLHGNKISENSANRSGVVRSLRPLTIAFMDVLIKLWSNSETAVITPTFFLFKLREKCVQFRGFSQQDAQEFIRCFLDALHQELRRPVRKWELDLLHENNLLDFEQPSSSSTTSVADIISNSSELNLVNNFTKAKISLSHDSKDDQNDNDNEKFETADSGLSSDTEDTPKSKIKKVDNDKNDTFKTKVNDRDKIVGYKSIITDVFDGELVSSVRCQTCQHISYTKENFQDLSLSIPTVEQLEYLRESQPSTEHTISSTSTEAPEKNLKSMNENRTLNNVQYGYIYWIYALANRWFFRPWLNWFTYFYRCMFNGSISLENCLKAFFSTDFLHGEDMYSCEKCAKLRNGAKQCELIRLPEILCVHLKRFRHDNMYNSKVSTKVTFPLYDLDMRPFVRESVLENNLNMVTEYDLVAIISHRGSGIEYGHYVAYCRNDFDKNWYEFDDSMVTRVSTLEVMNREAYVLFYQKKTPESAEEIRTQCQKLLHGSLKRPLFAPGLLSNGIVCSSNSNNVVFIRIGI